MKLSLIKVSEKYREQICDMLDEWYASGENIVPYAIRRIDYHDTVAEEFGITEENAPRFTAFATDEGRLR